MKTKRIFLVMAMVVFAIGSVSAQETSAVNKFNEDGTVNEAALTKEELMWARLNNTPHDQLVGKQKSDKLRWMLMCGDNSYIGDDGMAYTTLTCEDVVKQGFPSFLYDMMQNGLKNRNEWVKGIIDKEGSDMLTQVVTAGKTADMLYKKDRPKLVAEMNAALKQAEAEEAAENK